MTESTSRFDYRCFHLHAETSDSGLLYIYIYILDSFDIIVKEKRIIIFYRLIRSLTIEVCEIVP